MKSLNFYKWEEKNSLEKFQLKEWSVRMTSGCRINRKKARAMAEKKEKELQRKRENILNVKARELPQEPSNMFLSYNTALGPPYRIILDTNFLNMSISNKLDIFSQSMDLLLGKCIPYLTECVVAELEKLGHKYKLAIKLTKDPRFKKLICHHKGTYADDCIVNRVKQFRCFIVATCDKDLKRRFRKIPGVPIMFISSHKYKIERLPDKIN